MENLVYAEVVGFEPTKPFRTLVFKTSAINHYATLPSFINLLNNAPPTPYFNIFTPYQQRVIHVILKTMVQQTVSSAQYLEKLRQRRATRYGANSPSNVMPNEIEKNSWQNKTQTDTIEQHNTTQTQSSKSQNEFNNQTNNSNQNPNPYLPESYKLRESKIAPGMMKPLPEEDILAWQAPSRPFKKHNRKFFTTVAVIALLVSLIFFFAGQGLLPVAVAGSVTFLVYVLFTIPPQQVTNKISTYGIRIENVLYYWEELGRFWFEDKYNQKILYVETARFPGRITLLLGKQNEEDLKNILSEVLLNKKPDLTFFEKAGQWLSKKVPLEFD